MAKNVRVDKKVLPPSSLQLHTILPQNPPHLARCGQPELIQSRFTSRSQDVDIHLLTSPLNRLFVCFEKEVDDISFDRPANVGGNSFAVSGHIKAGAKWNDGRVDRNNAPPCSQTYKSVTV